MSMKEKGKKRSIKKIVLAILAVVVVLVASVWFSLPKEMRNMAVLMIVPGESYDSYLEYQVIDISEDPLAPTAFTPSAATAVDTDANVNVAVVTEMVKNEDSGMLKKGNVETLGVDNYNGWYAIADEGSGDEYPFGPSPLSYYTSGLASNLHTQVIKAAEVKGIELDSVTVEVRNTFRWNEMLTEDGAGYLDLSTVNIIIESNESKEVINEIKEIALNSWATGEALRNKTVIEPTLVVNGDNWDNYRAVPGTTNSEISIVNDLTVTSVSEVARTPMYIDLLYKDQGMTLSVDAMSNMEFEIFAIAETATNSERPYLTKITVSTPSEETWEIYSDEFMSEDDKPLAPTPLEYFTMGTALCLTSQTTLVSSMMGLDYTDYRVENQMDYRQEDIDTIDMASYTDIAHSYIVIESKASQEQLESFFHKSLSLCFAGEGLMNETTMDVKLYLNSSEVK